MNQELAARINQLTYTELVEVANFYFPVETGVAGTAAMEARLSATVTRHGGDYRQLKDMLGAVHSDETSTTFLIRTALLQAARGTPAQQRQLAEAIAGVGQSQVVVELLYAILAATCFGLAWLAIPPQEKTTRTSTETRTDGSKVTMTEETTKDIPPPVEQLYGWIKNLLRGKD